MRTRQAHIFALLAFLVAMPLAAFDMSSVKQGAPVRHGNIWEQRSEFAAAVKEGARLVLRADNGGITIHPVPGERVSCTVILHAYTPDEAAARRLFDKFQLTARSMETGGIYLSSESPERGGHGANFRVQFQITVPQQLQSGCGNTGRRYHRGCSLGGRSAAHHGGRRRALERHCGRGERLKPPAAALNSAGSAAT